MNETLDRGNRLIVALDVPDRRAADALVARLDGAVTWLKIGLELFVAEGPNIACDYAGRGFHIMLDLKLHDIPATVERATRRIAELGASLLTVHAAGGADMLRAAVRGAAGDRDSAQLRILAVTALTSLDAGDLADIGVTESVADVVTRRARLAVQAGCHGVVASPREAARLRAEVPADFLLVCPGVRPRGSDAGDQKRVTTPAEARGQGADLLVCGRPIRDAPDPAAAARAIAEEIAAAGD